MIFILELNKTIQGDALSVLKTLPSNFINMCITSPPYWGLRDYENEKQIGNEATIDEYINKLCDVFDEVYRVLKEDATLWVNIGDTYINNTSNKHLNLQKKSLAMIPSRFAIEMINRGWICRNEIIWHKPNAMPSPVKDRFTVDYEKIFLFSKTNKYYFEQQKEPNKDSYNGKRGSSKTRKKMQSAMRDVDNIRKIYEERNIRTVWSINTKPFKEAHFATYPDDLIIIPIKSGCPYDGIVLDPFSGSGTTGFVCTQLGRNYLQIELNNDYIEISNKRINGLKKGN